MIQSICFHNIRLRIFSYRQENRIGYFIHLAILVTIKGGLWFFNNWFEFRLGTQGAQALGLQRLRFHWLKSEAMLQTQLPRMNW